MSTKPKILCVDDEDNVLSSIKRQLHKEFSVSTTIDTSEALQRLKDEEPFAAVLSDMRMPAMNGDEFLAKAKNIAPHTTRIMLTGNNDQETAALAVNKGEVFRFLNKPCDRDDLIVTLQAACEQHRLQTLEQDLLQKTLMGSIQVLFDILSMTNTVAFGQTVRMQEWVKKIASTLQVENFWQLEVATMLGQIGCLTIPPELLKKEQNGEELKANEKQMLFEQTHTTKKLLQNIPRLESVTAIIALQNSKLDTAQIESKDPIIFSAAIIQTVRDFDRFLQQGKDYASALEALKRSEQYYNAEILQALSQAEPAQDTASVITPLEYSQLKPGMSLAEDLVMKSGMLLAPKGFKLNEAFCLRLVNFDKQGELEKTVIQVSISQ